FDGEDAVPDHAHEDRGARVAALGETADARVRAGVAGEDRAARGRGARERRHRPPARHDAGSGDPLAQALLSRATARARGPSSPLSAAAATLNETRSDGGRA